MIAFKANHWIKCSVIGVLCLICYSQTLFGDIVFDDTEAVLKNKDVMTNTPLTDVFSNDFWGTKISDNSSHKSYRPLTVIAFRLIRQFDDFIQSRTESNGSDLNPYLLHFINILCYVFTNILLFKVLIKVLNTFCLNFSEINETNERNAFLSTIIFSCHPIHSEVVCAVVGLADLLSSLFALTALLIYLEFVINQKRNNFVVTSINCVLVVIVTGMAMLFKEQGITFIGLCVLFDLMTLFEKQNIVLSKVVIYYRMVILCFGALLLLIFRIKVMDFRGPQFQSGDNPTAFEESVLIRFINYNYIYAINGFILVYPEWLCFDWSMTCISLIRKAKDFRILFVIIFWIIVLLLIKSCVTHKKSTLRRQLQISIAFCVIPFIPSSNIFFTVGFVVAERALFLPSIGFVLLLITGINSLEQRFRTLSKTLYLFVIIVTIVFTFRTIERTFDWMNETQLFESGLSVCPSNAKIHYNIAKKAADSGLKEKAIEEYQKAIDLFPEYDNALNNLANILKDLGDLNQSKQLLERAVKIRPSFAAAWMNLAIVQMALKQYTEAEISYLNGIKHRQRYAECFYNLGNLYVKQNRFDDAFRVWRNATLIKPSLLSAWNNIIIMLDNIGSYEKAETIALEALHFHPNESTLHFNYGNVLGKIKKFISSEKHFKIAITLSPENASYYSNLAVLYHQWNNYSEALTYYQKALKIDPNLINAKKNIKILNKTLNKEN